MPRVNAEKAVLAAAENKGSQFCEVTAGRPAMTAALLLNRIELETDISIEIRNAAKAMLGGCML